MSLLAALRGVPGLAPLAAALPCAVALLFLRGAAAPWWLVIAAACAVSALSRLLGTWCADPALGAILAATAALSGIAVQAPVSRPDEDEAVSWAAGAGLIAALLPVLLRFLGLNTASAVCLEEPLCAAVFALGQVWLACVLASAAAARAARGLAHPAGAPERTLPLLAALAASAGAIRLESSVLLAAAGAAMAVAAVLRARPWTQWRTRPLRARALALCVPLAAMCAMRSPGLMRDVWTARLDAAYPGGRFLSLVDDGIRQRCVYEFSIKDRISLRDGTLQGDEVSGRVAAMALRGQRSIMSSALLVDPPTPAAPRAAAALGLTVALDEGSLPEAAVLDALGGEGWRAALSAPKPGEKPDGAILFLPRPLRFAQARRLGGAAALRALRERLTARACAVIVLPSGESNSDVDAVESSAREVFGAARAARAGQAFLIAACPDEIETDPSVIYSRIPFAQQMADPEGDKVLARNLRWR